MQVRVAKRLPFVLTVSGNSKIDINKQMQVPLDRLTVVPVGVDHNVFKPYPDVVKKIRRWGHDQLTTYGIGPELDERGWSAVARELMRLGHVAVSPGEFATLELTDSGLEVLRTRTPIQLTMPGGGAVETHGMTISFDKVLLSSEPVIGSTVVESDREYIINSVSGGETWATSWRVQCVEKERQ